MTTVGDGDHHPAPVAYLTKRFPRLSETFILDEILALEDAGVPLQLLSIADPHEAVVQPDVARVTSFITYLQGEPGLAHTVRQLRRQWAAHRELWGVDRTRYLQLLAAAARARNRRVAMRHFVQAGLLAVLVRRSGARHLHAAFAHTPAAVAYQVHLLTGLPFSFAAHAKDLYLSDPVDLASRAAAAEFVLVCSASAERDLRAITGTSTEVRLQHHGVDTAAFHPATEAAMASPRQPLRLLAVGRLVEKKGYPVLLQALAQVADGGRRVRCRIIGAGPLQAVLRRQIEELGLRDCVELRGALTREDVTAAYRDADAFVQTSVVLADGDRDGIPNSVLEAMSCGLPVVASAVAGIPEVIDHGVTGVLVPPGESSELAAALVTLADDPVLRRTLGRNARAHVVAHLDRAECGRSVAELFARRTAVAEAPT